MSEKPPVELPGLPARLAEFIADFAFILHLSQWRQNIHKSVNATPTPDALWWDRSILDEQYGHVVRFLIDWKPSERARGCSFVLDL